MSLEGKIKYQDALFLSEISFVNLSLNSVRFLDILIFEPEVLGSSSPESLF